MNTKHKKNGMTLVEVMIASLLCALLIGGIYSGIIQAQKATYAASQHVAAFNLCKEQLEQMRGAEYSDVNLANYGTSTNIMTHLGGSNRIPIYSIRTCTITPATNPERKIIAVTVTWSFMGKKIFQSANGAIYKKTR